ncbi:HbrB-like-domain-containing protein [Mortierella sp. GBAus27b]|nr:HbrB-like-domain-containing protein [Mortierella sp. GBAus27b]
MSQGLSTEDVWQTLCIKVLTLFNGQGLTGAIEDLNELKLVSRLVEVWSFFFGTVLPYFEGVFLPLQIELKAKHAKKMLEKSIADSEPENVRTMALSGFRDLVIIPMVDRLGDVFVKLFLDIDASIPVADTASRMLQMTAVLCSIQSGDGQQLLMEQVSNRLKTNWRQFTRKGNRGAFIGLERRIAPAQTR